MPLRRRAVASLSIAWLKSSQICARSPQIRRQAGGQVASSATRLNPSPSAAYDFGLFGRDAFALRGGAGLRGGLLF